MFRVLSIILTSIFVIGGVVRENMEVVDICIILI